jgi:polyhydroxyalkanoate synthesis regulator phasin
MASYKEQSKELKEIQEQISDLREETNLHKRGKGGSSDQDANIEALKRLESDIENKLKTGDFDDESDY